MESMKVSECLCFYLCFDNTDSASNLAGTSSRVANKHSPLVHVGSSLDACLDPSDRTAKADRNDDLNREERNHWRCCKEADSSMEEGCLGSLDSSCRGQGEAWIARTRDDWLAKRHSWGEVDSPWELVL